MKPKPYGVRELAPAFKRRIQPQSGGKPPHSRMRSGAGFKDPEVDPPGPWLPLPESLPAHR
jgi:hypothetical protein